MVMNPKAIQPAASIVHPYHSISHLAFKEESKSKSIFAMRLRTSIGRPDCVPDSRAIDVGSTREQARIPALEAAGNGFERLSGANPVGLLRPGPNTRRCR